MGTHFLNKSIYLTSLIMLTLVAYTMFIENGFLMRIADSSPLMFNAFVISGLGVSLLNLTGWSERKIKNAEPVFIVFGVISLIYYVGGVGVDLLFV